MNLHGHGMLVANQAPLPRILALSARHRHRNVVAFFSQIPKIYESEGLRVFLVAGEASGDAIGGRLMAAMKKICPWRLEFNGVGGISMEKEGLVSLFKMDDIAIMGITELIPYVPMFLARLKDTVMAASLFRPHIVITIDAKGFNFRFLQRLKDQFAQTKHKKPFCVHYVSPSFWAWKGGEKRMKNLSQVVDHLLCLLPFEAAAWRCHGLPATFVGHPVLEDYFSYHNASSNCAEQHNWQIKGDGKRFLEHHSLSSAATIISVLPGSRMQELKRMLPIYEVALKMLSKDCSDLIAVIPTVENDDQIRFIRNTVKGWTIKVITLPGASVEHKYDAFAASRIGLSTSGTAVLQLQMARLPSVVAYRANWVTEQIIKHRTTMHYISLPNILLDAHVIPEALFSSCTPEIIVSLLRNILYDKEHQRKQIFAAENILQILTPPAHVNSRRPSCAAAHTILKMLSC